MAGSRIRERDANSVELEPGYNLEQTDTQFLLEDNDDPTKEAIFQLSALTTATQRTYTLPDVSGVLWVPQFARIDASRNLVDDGTDQAVFPTTNDAITLKAGETYLFDGMYSLTKGANDVDTFMLFGGTATLTTIRYFVTGSTAATAGAAGTPLSKIVAVATEAEVAANGTGVHVIISFHGCVEVNAAGTFIPQVNFSAATGSTPAVNVDTYFRITPIGQNPVTAIGAWG